MSAVTEVRFTCNKCGKKAETEWSLSIPEGWLVVQAAVRNDQARVSACLGFGNDTIHACGVACAVELLSEFVRSLTSKPPTKQK